ncbi:MAG: 50S ribosomal protein L25 [Acidimicrobiia bacterium]|nr:MAG: 50S ribosomal protein L25 [Acidimicrobiia bacterium]
MEQEKLRAQKRVTSGTRPARRMRREGRIPAVVYGTGLETVSISIDSRELDATLRTEAGLNALINVVVEDGDEVLAVAREIQRDPVRGNITHVDLIKVSLDVEIEAEVSLSYVGIPVGVREEEGFIEAIETTVAILALPTAIPSSIEVDITDLGIGDTLKVGDLVAIEGVTYTTDVDRPLVTVLLPVIEEEPEVELLEGEELEEGEEGEPVEGEEEAEAADGGEDTAKEG